MKRGRLTIASNHSRWEAFPTGGGLEGAHHSRREASLFGGGLVKGFHIDPASALDRLCTDSASNLLNLEFDF